jgi:hypothetical protein
LTQIRVYIATTEGPSEVQSLIEEDPGIHSVVCLDGKANALPISPAYNIFVRRGAGVIERDFGHPAFRLDVAEPITNGSSWQLGVYAAHALAAEERLAKLRDNADEAIWLSGEVDRELQIHPVSGIADKIQKSKDLMGAQRENAPPITLYLHPNNAEEARAELGSTATIIDVTTIEELCRKLGLPTPKFYEENKAVTAVPVKATQIRQVAPVKGKSLMIAGSLAVILVVAVFSIWRAGYANWSALLAKGQYQNLSQSLESAQESDCLTCRLSEKIFRWQLKSKPPSTNQLALALDALRAPAGRQCGNLSLSTSQLNKHPLKLNGEGRYELQQSKSLCAVLFEISRPENSTGTAWTTLLAPPITDRFRGMGFKTKVMPYRLLTPGQKVAFKFKVAAYLTKALSYSLVTVTTLNGISKDLKNWLTRAHKNKNTNWRALKEEFKNLGIAMHIQQLTILPDEKKRPRFQ